MVAQRISQRGYFVVELKRSSGGRKEQAGKQVHRLVLEAFVGPCPSPRHEPCHGPNGKLDNRVSELRWGTPEENNGPDKVRDGKSNRGERCGSAILTAAAVIECRRRYAAGEMQAALAVEFGVNSGSLSSAITGKNWGWLAGAVPSDPKRYGKKGVDHHNAKLTPADVVVIRQRYAAGGSSAISPVISPCRSRRYSALLPAGRGVTLPSGSGSMPWWRRCGPCR